MLGRMDMRIHVPKGCKATPCGSAHLLAMVVAMPCPKRNLEAKAREWQGQTRVGVGPRKNRIMVEKMDQMAEKTGKTGII